MENPDDPIAAEQAAEIEVLHGEIAQLVQQLTDAAGTTTDNPNINRMGGTCVDTHQPHPTTEALDDDAQAGADRAIARAAELEREAAHLLGQNDELRHERVRLCREADDLTETNAELRSQLRAAQARLVLAESRQRFNRHEHDECEACLLGDGSCGYHEGFADAIGRFGQFLYELVGDREMATAVINHAAEHSA